MADRQVVRRIAEQHGQGDPLQVGRDEAHLEGTPVSVSLRVLSQEQRDERLSKAEEKAGKLPAQLTVPMIMFLSASVTQQVSCVLAMATEIVHGQSSTVFGMWTVYSERSWR